MSAVDRTGIIDAGGKGADIVDIHADRPVGDGAEIVDRAGELALVVDFNAKTPAVIVPPPALTMPLMTFDLSIVLVVPVTTMPSPVTSILPLLEISPLMVLLFSTRMPVPLKAVSGLISGLPGAISPVLPRLPVNDVPLTTIAVTRPLLLCGNGPV